MTPEQTELLTMALSLLTTMMLFGALAAWFFRNYFSCSFIVIAFLVSVALIFLAIPISQSGNVPLIFFVSACFGASVAADFGGFALLLGRQRDLEPETVFRGVAIAFGITTIVTILAGAIGIYGGINFQGMGAWLFAGLWVLIGLGVAGIVGWISERAEYFIGIGASVFWGIYMIYNFNKVVDLYTEATWPAAMDIAMNLYLDIINFLVRILPYVLDAMD